MRHFDVASLAAVMDGRLPPSVLVRWLLHHLGDCCPECREVLRQAGEVAPMAGVAPPVSPAVAEEAAAVAARLPDAHHVGAFDGSAGAAQEWSKQVRRERRRARRDLRELLRTAPEAREARVVEARTRFRSRALAELLLEECRRVVREDPEQARSLARLVAPVLLWTPGAEGTGWARSLALRALAWEANTLRVGGDLRTADRAFRRLRARMARELVDDSALYAEVGSLEASLRMAQGALEAARQALDEAVLLYRSAGERVPLARVLMQRAIVERREGRSGAAVATQQEVLTLLDPERDRELHLMGVANLALYLVEVERWPEARELMAVHQEALEEASLWRTANVRILRSRLARAGGSADEAERLLLEARADLIAREDPLRAAVVSLDLAVIYLEQGRTAELRRMARLMETIFESQDLHDEAMAALLLFRQAVAADTVTVEALFALRRRLEGQASPRRRRPAATHADAPS